MSKPVCLIVGAGAGIGGNVAKRFARDGYHACRFHYCEGMVMPPINPIVVHTLLLPPERRNEEILGQAKRLLTKTLEPLNEALAGAATCSANCPAWTSCSAMPATWRDASAACPMT